MFEKNKCSAILMSMITVLSFAGTYAVLTILIPYMVTSDIHVIVENPENLNNPEAILGLLAFLAILLLILVSICAFWFYRFFGERYYGRRGAVRWGLFGFTFALLMWLPSWLTPNLNRILVSIWQFMSLFLAYAITRKLIPLRK